MNPNELLAQTVAQLQNQLQAIHEKLGAPATQNVRNLDPAHVTIIACLPTRRCDAICAKDLYAKFVAKGGRVTRNSFNVVLSQLLTRNKISNTFSDNKYWYYFGLYA